jgi:hypothetical protein
VSFGDGFTADDIAAVEDAARFPEEGGFEGCEEEEVA